MTIETTGMIVLFTFLLAVIVIVIVAKIPDYIKVIICAALMLRVCAAVLRYNIIVHYYKGFGDAISYYASGLRYATQFKQLEFASLYNSKAWHGGDWWGTQMIKWLAGIVLSVIQLPPVGVMIVFSFLGFLGILAFYAAFCRAYPAAKRHMYLMWICLYPSLLFWTASIGKEAVLMLGLGLVVLGYSGRHGTRIQWISLVSGLVTIFAVRPQLAAIVLVTLILTEWLSFSGRWTLRKVAEGILVLVVGMVGIQYSSQSIGLEQFDVEGVQSFMESYRTRGSTTAGSTVELVNTGVKGVPVAFLNIMTRPYIWEANNAMMLFSSLEIMALWGIIFFKRKKLFSNLRNWRSDRMIRFSICFLVLYCIGLGMMTFNLGIIARQRVFIFPFIFLLLEGGTLSAVPWRRGYNAPAKRVPVRSPLHPAV